MYSIHVLIYCVYIDSYLNINILINRFRERESIPMTVNMETCETNFDPMSLFSIAKYPCF